MKDQIFDRDYQVARAELNASIDRLIAAVAYIPLGLRVLHRRTWSAPWLSNKRAA